MMAISLQEFFIGQKVYASNEIVGQPPKITNTLANVICSPLPDQGMIDKYNFQDNGFYTNLCRKKDSENIMMCYNDITKKDINDIQDCNNVNDGKLTTIFCEGKKDPKSNVDFVWKNISNLTAQEKSLITIKNNTWGCACPNGYVVGEDGQPTSECLKNTAGDLGINCGPQQLKNGTCTWNINKTLGIRSSETTPNPTLLLQDVVLAATSFIGTLIMIALVVMGVKYVQGGFDESATGDLKGNIKKLLIGLFLVIGSYTIIRLVQYVARGY